MVGVTSNINKQELHCGSQWPHRLTVILSSLYKSVNVHFSPMAFVDLQENFSSIR